MNKHIIIHTIAAAFTCSAAFADEQKKEAVKAEAKNGEARAEARAFSSTTTTTNVNGKPVTITEDLDENGKKRIRMITYVNGKPKVKDITPKDKPAANDANGAKKPAEGAK